METRCWHAAQLATNMAFIHPGCLESAVAPAVGTDKEFVRASESHVFFTSWTGMSGEAAIFGAGKMKCLLRKSAIKRRWQGLGSAVPYAGPPLFKGNAGS